MAIYKILFHPLEAYFFGDEGSFSTGVENAEYFITSRLFPSQTTLFGILRYLNLRHLKDRGTYSPEEKKENIQAIGKKSFCMRTAIDLDNKNTEKNTEQNFGMIKAISSVFLHEYDLQNKVNRIYLPLPKDVLSDDKFYTSVFAKGEEKINTLHGEKLRPLGYDAKKGLGKGFISIDAGINDFGEEENGELNVIKSPFEYVLKTGLRINKKRQSTQSDDNQEPMSSLFKKEYVRLRQEIEQREYSFGIYAQIEDDEDDREEEVLDRLNRVVGMGLGSALFRVKTQKVEEEAKKRLEDNLVLKVDKIFEAHPKKENLVYCISPCYVANPKYFLEKVQFSSIDTIASRPMSSGNIDKVWKKESTLYRMLDAGSILIVESSDEGLETLDKKGLQQIGYNHYYMGGKK